MYFVLHSGFNAFQILPQLVLPRGVRMQCFPWLNLTVVGGSKIVDSIEETVFVCLFLSSTRSFLLGATKICRVGCNKL